MVSQTHTPSDLLPGAPQSGVGIRVDGDGGTTN